MSFADNLSKMSYDANHPKRFDPNRVNCFLKRFEYHCETVAKTGGSSFQMEYIEEIRGAVCDYDETIFILPKMPYMKWALMGSYKNFQYEGAIAVEENSFPLEEIINTLNAKLQEMGFKHKKIEIIQKPYEYKGRIFKSNIMAKVISVSVSW